MDGNLLTATAKLAMHITLSYIEKGDFVIDATCGNGNDTLALSQAAGEQGLVLAIDLQHRAIEETERLLIETGVQNVKTVQGNFLNLSAYTEEFAEGRKPSAIIFNLGYLPGGDKTVTTCAKDSLQAAEIALDLIRVGGIVTIVLYPGHAEGFREKELLLKWAEGLKSGIYHTMYASLPNQKKNPPEILWITKKKR